MWPTAVPLRASSLAANPVRLTGTQLLPLCASNFRSGLTGKRFGCNGVVFLQKSGDVMIKRFEHGGNVYQPAPEGKAWLDFSAQL